MLMKNVAYCTSFGTLLDIGVLFLTTICEKFCFLQLFVKNSVSYSYRLSYELIIEGCQISNAHFHGISSINIPINQSSSENRRVWHFICKLIDFVPFLLVHS